MVYPTSAQQQDTPPERMDAHTVLFTYEGKQYMGFDLGRSKELRKAEIDAVAYKSELQDEKVKYGKLEWLYGEQAVVLKACSELSGNGPKILGDWRVELGFRSAPIITTLLKPCR